jgi:hypothetical protein
MVVTGALSDPVYGSVHHLRIGRKASAMLKDNQSQRTAIKAVAFVDMEKWGVLQSFTDFPSKPGIVRPGLNSIILAKVNLVSAYRAAVGAVRAHV